MSTPRLADPQRQIRKGPPTMLIAMILLSVGLAAVAQLALKTGMNGVNDELAPATFSLNGASLKAIAVQPFVWGGLLLFGLSSSASGHLYHVQTQRYLFEVIDAPRVQEIVEVPVAVEVEDL